MYFIITGVYYYRIKIDSSVVYVTAYRIIFSSIKTRDLIDISHDTLVDYTFFNRSLTFNTILMLRIIYYRELEFMLLKFQQRVKPKYMAG